MRQATPMGHILAQRLLRQEAEESTQSEITLLTTLKVFGKLQKQLTKLIGVAGFRALIARALGLAQSKASWLTALHVKADGTLEEFNALNQQQAEEGGVLLLEELIRLLVILIGADLTLRLMRDTWPQASLNDVKLSTEENPL